MSNLTTSTVLMNFTVTTAENFTSTTIAATTEEPGREPYPQWVFILVECLYVLLYAIAMAVIYKVGVLKDDDDAVTIHHKLHAEMIEKQEEKFVEEQQGDLARATASKEKAKK